MPTRLPAPLINKKYYLFTPSEIEGLTLRLRSVSVPSGIEGLICAFTTRHYGNMLLAKQRQNFLYELGIDYKNLVCAKQVHGSQIRYVQEEGSIDNTDALITDRKNLPLAIFTADCLSIFLYDPLRPAIGLIHTGWRSTQENITAKTVKLLQKEFNTEPKNLSVGFGPAIRECCYKVSQDFSNFFSYDLIETNDHYYLDLVKINKIQLLDSGVKEINIFDSKICTSCQNQEFFSYRKEGNSCGRIMALIMLR